MRNKILFLSDDIRGFSGVSNISKKLILNTCADYDWVQLSASATEGNNQIIDVSDSITKITGVDDTYVRLYPVNGYGNPVVLRELIKREQPDAILHMTDPYRWNWLYEMEHEIRKSIPMLYYHVWDNTPYPHFLKDIYDSCDWVGCISKLTHRCVNKVVPEHKNINYIPHGVDLSVFKKLDNRTIQKHKEGFLGKNYSFVLFSNNVNIPRKQLTNVILSFSKFYDKLNNDEQDQVVLLMHTDPNHTTGSNLLKLIDDCYPHLPVKFSTEKVDDVWLNNIYNLASATINIASNEGFGITTLESLATSTPIIVNKTGGLLDQHDESCGVCVEPKVKSLLGSKHTPYIYSDICCTNDVADAIYKIYKNKSNYDDEDKYSDLIRRNKFNSSDMCSSIKESINFAIENFQPTNSFRITKVCRDGN